MASTTAAASSTPRNDLTHEVSVARLWVLRGTYLLLIVGLGLTNLPELIRHEPQARGVIPRSCSSLSSLMTIAIRSSRPDHRA